MKQKFLKSTMVFCTIVVSMILGNRVFAQDAVVNSGVHTQTQMGDQPMKMQSNDAISIKSANGITTILDAKGTVKVETIGANGQIETETIAKPSVNTSVLIGTAEMAADMSIYITNYIHWMKANPEYKNYVSDNELSFINNSDFEHLYKTNYYLSQKLNNTK